MQKQNYLLTGKYALKSNAYAYNFGWICLYTNMSRAIGLLQWTCNSTNDILCYRLHDSTLNVEVDGLIAIYEV